MESGSANIKIMQPDPHLINADPKPCLPGKKLLICDNLSSHVSLEVISLCRENNIEYVCLPPNSTDKMQPLDVGIFGSINPIILFPSLSKQ
jgi:hypothetical protein